ncbi:MAG: M16 family metallopeptidase [Longimicrobiales bacterium]
MTRAATVAASDRFAAAELDGGLLVLTEEMPWVRSAAIGIWVRWGSAHELPREMGVSHLLEHMVFKGTQRRSARELALVLERLGGSLDAYTTREHTSFQARVLDEHVEDALDVLADMVLTPLLRPTDLELERRVVLEEIAAVEDTPDDLVFDLHAAELWGQHPYGYSILGTRATISALSEHDLRRVHDRAYSRPNLIVAAAGNIRHDEVVAQVERQFAPAPSGAAAASLPQPSAAAPHVGRVPRDSSQTHLVFGTSTFGHSDPRRYALVLLSNAFGGGMSSRLFQRVREELGLAYTVYSYQTFYRDAGVCGVYVGTRRETADLAEATIREEMARLAAHGLSSTELADAKGQVKGQIVLSLESSGARLHRLAGVALYDEPFLSLDELVARVDAVSAEEVAAVAAEYADPERQVLLRLGPD